EEQVAVNVCRHGFVGQQAPVLLGIQRTKVDPVLWNARADGYIEKAAAVRQEYGPAMRACSRLRDLNADAILRNTVESGSGRFKVAEDNDTIAIPSPSLPVASLA